MYVTQTRPSTTTTRLIYAVAVARKEKDCEICSEVKHLRFKTGSDTVIHSAQIKTCLSLELTLLSAKNYTNTSTKLAHHGQSVAYSPMSPFFHMNNTKLNKKAKITKTMVSFL